MLGRPWDFSDKTERANHPQVWQNLTSARGGVGLLWRGINTTRQSRLPSPFHKELAVTRLILNILSDEDGAVATEYAVMLALILMGVFAAVSTVGDQSGGMWGNIVTKIVGAETEVP